MNIKWQQKTGIADYTLWVFMLPTLHLSRLLHKKEIQQSGWLQQVWQLANVVQYYINNGLGTMYVCTDSLCVVCIRLLSDEFPTVIVNTWLGRPTFWKARELAIDFLTQESWRSKHEFWLRMQWQMEEWDLLILVCEYLCCPMMLY